MNRAVLIGLCLLTVLIGWGISWELLPLQTGSADLPQATVPVFYRFLLGGAIFTAFVIVRDLIRRHISFRCSISTWGLIALLGLGLFSLNYSLYYIGQRGLPPGLVALFFAFVVITNLGMSMLFTGKAPQRSTTIAAGIGFLGLIAVLSPGIWADGEIQIDWFTLQQSGLCLLGTLVVSFATRVQVELNRREIPVITSTAFAMLFGASYVGIYSFWQGYSFDITMAPSSFYYALIFLVILGSIGAFSAYLKLVGLIGPDRGGYVNLGTAVMALIISYFVGTGDDLNMLQFGGIALILGGTFLILRDAQRSGRRQRQQEKLTIRSAAS